MSATIERFLNWTRDAPAPSRADAARALARAFLVSPLSPEERDEVETALTVLLDDPALDVRISLADVLASSELTPQHIILTLAGDKDPVASLVAERSPLILDSELVDMAATRTERVQVAIARRPFLSRSVSAAIAEVATSAACIALLSNPGARVLRFSLDRIVERHGGSPELRAALLEREDLPIEIRQILTAKLGDAGGAGGGGHTRCARMRDDCRRLRGSRRYDAGADRGTHAGARADAGLPYSRRRGGAGLPL